MQLLNWEKELFANTVTMTFSVSPNLHLFRSVDALQFFSFNDSGFLNPSFTYSQQDSSFTATFSVSSGISLENILLMLTANEAVDARFYATDDSGWELTLNNPHPLLMGYYSDGQYTLSRIIFILSILITAGGCGVCLLGIGSPNRLAGLEAVLVIQFAGVCLLWVGGEITLPVYCLENLLHSTGYHHAFSDSTTNNYPPQAVIFDYDSVLLASNFNFIGLLYPLCLLCLFVSKLLTLRAVDNDDKVIAEERVEFSC